MTPTLDAVRREELRKLIEAMPDWVRRRWSVIDAGRDRGSIMVACAADTLLSLHRRAYPRSEEVAIGAYIAAMSPDTTLALLARIAELEAGLRPFAEFIPDLFDDGHQDDDVVSLTSYHGNLDLTLTVADFRRSAALLPKASVREERR